MREISLDGLDVMRSSLNKKMRDLMSSALMRSFNYEKVVYDTDPKSSRYGLPESENFRCLSGCGEGGSGQRAAIVARTEAAVAHNEGAVARALEASDGNHEVRIEFLNAPLTLSAAQIRADMELDIYGARPKIYGTPILKPVYEAISGWAESGRDIAGLKLGTIIEMPDGSKVKLT